MLKQSHRRSSWLSLASALVVATQLVVAPLPAFASQVQGITPNLPAFLPHSNGAAALRAPANSAVRGPGEIRRGTLVPDFVPSSLSSASADWWATAQEEIRLSEYRLTWQDCTSLPDIPAAYQAPNRAHNLRTYFTSAGIRIVPRAESEPAWEWGLTLTGYGYAGSVESVGGAAQAAADSNRFEYRYESASWRISEWYLNDERGLEQGFTIASPSLPRSSAPLLLEMSLSGDLIPALTEDGSAVEFSAPGGARVLRYGDLYATDATGRALPAHLELASRITHPVLRLAVDDSDAVYPITIDPLILSPNWTVESDQVEAYMSGMSTAGDVNGDGYADVIVSAFAYDVTGTTTLTDAGQAYVYYGSATGLSSTADWTGEGDQDGAVYGYSVSAAGDVNGDGYDDVIVGAYGYDIVTGTLVLTDAGRAYLYYGSASGLSTTPDWTADGDQINGYFGVRASTIGDVNGDGYDDIVVGAYYDNPETDEGRAYVYYGSASGLSATAGWTAEGNQAYAYFGGAADTAGDVNGDGYDDAIIAGGGQAYVYRGSATGLSTTAYWTVENSQAEFGSVSTAGDVNGDGYADVIVGAGLYTHGQEQEGGAFVYLGSASGPSTTPNATIESGQSGARLGQSVGDAGDVNGDGYGDVVVGVPGYDNPDMDEGRAYVYYGSASGLNTTVVWLEEGNNLGARLGSSVGTAGDVNGDGYDDVIVAAELYSNPQYREGRVFLYYGRPDPVTLSPNWTADGNQVAAVFGTTASTAGDVNGDGYDDVIAGASNYDGGEADEGRAFLYYGSASGLSLTPAWAFESNQASACFGSSGGSAGDVNGDGYDDVIIAAYNYTGVYTHGGRVYVFYGSASGLSLTPDWTVEGSQANLLLGAAVSMAGDVNGDGYDDVIVATTEYGNGEAYEGVAYVYYGSASGLSATPGWAAESNQAGARFGMSVDTAGDVNGDGYDDVIVGAHWYGQAMDGRAFVYYGSAAGLSCGVGECPADANAVADWTAESHQSDSRFGWAVSTAGDVNGDGYDDVLIGAYWYDNGPATQLGRAFVYHGSDSGLACGAGCPVGPDDADWMVEGDQSNAGFAYMLNNAGDVNGDGFDDVAVAAPWYDSGQIDEGKIFVYFGWSSGLNTTPNWTAETDQSSETRFGAVLGPAGDVNDDGYDDIVVGSYYYTADQANEGRVFVYYGWAPGVVTDCSNYSATGGLGPALNRGGTITFKCNGTIVIPATIGVARDITLDATGQDVTISGNNAVRVFYVNSGITLTLKSLTVANGRIVGAAGANGSPCGTGASGSPAYGGGIYNNGGTVNVLDSTFSGNSAVGGRGGNGGYGQYNICPGGSGGAGSHGRGGAIYNSAGKVTVAASTFSGNSAWGGNGGNAGSSSNYGTGYGGSGGHGYGGAIHNDGGLVYVTNVTFSGNGATGGNGGFSDYTYKFGSGGNGYGGGVYIAGVSVTANNVTFSENIAAGGGGSSSGVGYSGGIYNSSGTVTLKNTIVANNAGGNCSGTITSAGYNLDNGVTCNLTGPGDMSFTSPLLGPLQDNGGATFTRALLQGSPAINAGNPLPPGWYADSCAIYDQRGAWRPLGGRCDIGAYEYDRLIMTKVVSPTSDAPYHGVLTYTITLNNYGTNDVPVILTDTLPGAVDFAAWVNNPGASVVNDRLEWGGTLTWGQVISFSFTVTHTGAYNEVVDNTAVFSSPGYTGTATATFGVLCGMTVTVQNTNSDGLGSLRQAVSQEVCTGGVVNFAPTLAGQTINPGNTLGLARSLTIDGSGLSQPVQVSGNNLFRVFYVNSGITVTLSHIGIISGSVTGTENGGGIYNAGTLTITNDVFSGNTVNNYGGGIYNVGTVNLRNSTFLKNSAGLGGGLSNEGALTVQNSTFSSNTAGYGGGIFNAMSPLTVQNSTFSGNTVNYSGGGIYNSGALNMQHSTFSGNTASVNGGGIFNGLNAFLYNTLLANNSGGDCGGNAFSSSLNNLADDSTCIGGFTQSSLILLGVLGDYGGDTQTMPLLPGSAAINAGYGLYCTAQDQRGVNRVGQCDVGAFESRGFTLAKTGGDNQSAPISTAFSQPLQVTLSETGGSPLPGAPITFTVPGSGASVILTGNPVTTTSSGLASVNATANSIVGGPYTVTAHVNGGTPSVNFTLTNLKAGTATSLAVSPNPSVYGQPVAFTATVTSAFAIPGGVVTFTIDADAVTVTLDANGMATYLTDTLSDGAHAITATYGGDDTFMGSSDGLIQVVQIADLSIAKTVTPASALPGQAVTFTLVFSNAGSLIATDVFITDTIPVSLTVTGVISSGVGITDTGAAHPYAWRVQDMGVGARGIITITGVLSSPLASGVFTNAAVIATETVERDATNNTGTVEIWVGNVAPAAMDDNSATDEDTPLSVPASGVLANDGDANGDPLTVSGYSATSVHGASVTVNADGGYSYDPRSAADLQVLAVGESMTDTFAYTVSDGILTDTATVSITVIGVNDAPVFTSTPVVVATQGVMYTYAVGAADVDMGDMLTITALVKPAWLTLVDHGDGTATISGTPTNAEVGKHSVTLQVRDAAVMTATQTFTITVGNVNDAPVANDDAASTPEDTSATIGVRANDGDPDGDILTVTAVGAPAHGAAGTDGATVVYTPTLNFNGQDVFTYTISDGDLTDTAAVTVTVMAANDAPEAEDDTASTAEDTPVTIGVRANDDDVENDPLTVVGVGAPAHGMATTNGATVTYTPTLDYNGQDVFTYTVSDGDLTDTAAVTVTVMAVNDAPIASDDSSNTPEDTPHVIAVLGNDTDPDTSDSLTVIEVGSPANGTASTNGTTVTYTPILNFNGQDVFTYTISDGVLTDTATITVTVSAANDPPVFTSAPVTAATEDVAYTYAITTTDVDAGDVLTVTAPVRPAWLALADHGDGTATLSGTPTNAGVGDHAVTLQVRDTAGAMATQSFTITVTATNTMRGVVLTPLMAAQLGNPGTMVTYTLRITNTGNAVDTFTLSKGSTAWTTDAPASVGPLAAGAGADVQVVVHIPSGASGGATDVASITATSQGDGSQSAGATLTTTAVTPATPIVTSITPNSGLNTDIVHVTNLAGDNFQSGAAVYLTRPGQATITATNVAVVSPSQIACDFDLSRAAVGQWNVVVTNPSGQSGQLAGGFTVRTAVYLPLVMRQYP